MNAIVIAFTLKGQPFETILPHLVKLSEENADAICIHGHMPRRVVEENGYTTDMVNALENLFPVQLNMWNEKTLREEMVEVATLLSAKVYVIGEIKEGVAEEVKLYQQAGLGVVNLEIETNGTSLQ